MTSKQNFECDKVELLMIHIFTDHQNRVIRLSDDSDETDSPYRSSSPEVSDLLDYAGRAIWEKDRNLEKKLKAWIEQYPEYPQLKNYLTAVYSRNRQNKKAFEYNHQIDKEHPGYLFAKVNIALEHLTRNELEKIPEVLGSSLDLQALYPERKIFHVSEYVNYYKIVAKYWLALELIDKARPVVSDLEKIEREFGHDYGIRGLSQLLVISSLKKAFESGVEQKEKSSTVRQEPTMQQTTRPPQFHFPQIQWLYENSFSIEKSKLEEILSLERSFLISDLCEVLYDGIKRYNFFNEKDFQPESQDFVLHALFLLQELKAGEALPAILEFLRQPEELLEFWLGDLVTEYCWQVLYITGKDQLATLKEFIKEPLNYSYSRTAASTVLSQLALHEPYRRSEVIALYRNLLDFFYENRQNKDVFDITVLSFIVSEIIDIRGRELSAEIKKCYDENLIDTTMEATWEEAKELLEEDDDDESLGTVKRDLQNIFELVEEQHQLEVELKKEEDEEEVFSGPPYDDEVSDKFSSTEKTDPEGTIIYSGDTPFKKDEPKTGRNDPCPCGSGKKYKKCHGKNS